MILQMLRAPALTLSDFPGMCFAMLLPLLQTVDTIQALQLEVQALS
jgi:hypothetical protein